MTKQFSFFYSGAKATYLLAVAILEIIRFTSNGGILNGGSSVSASRSAFSCAFEYLKSPNLTHAVSQCLTAIVHRAFQAAISWLVCNFLIMFIRWAILSLYKQFGLYVNCQKYQLGFSVIFFPYVFVSILAVDECYGYVHLVSGRSDISYWER